MVRVSVAVPGSTYDVVVAPGILEEAAAWLPELGGAEKAFVVADPTVASAYLERLAGGLDPWGWGWCTSACRPARRRSRSRPCPRCTVSWQHRRRTATTW